MGKMLRDTITKYIDVRLNMTATQKLGFVVIREDDK